jgi:hypothetical protein
LFLIRFKKWLHAEILDTGVTAIQPAMRTPQGERNGEKMDRKKVKLLYIGGHSRCGSTILSNILGEIDGFFNAGELLYIWDRILSQDGICGCGAHICKCKVWSMVLDEAFGSPIQVDCKEMIQLRNSEWQSIKIPLWMRLPAARSKLLSNLSKYFSNLGKLYSAIGSVLSGRVIIDSSKNPAYLYMLSLVPEVDLYIVHIIRDPRAAAYSWLRKKEGFSQMSSFRTALSWNARNFMLDLLGSGFDKRYMRLKYEDFIAYPTRVIKAIMDFVGEEQKELTFIKDDEVELGLNHCVFGNPDLFKTGMVKLRLDEKWKAMGRRDRIVATTLTWPLMNRYGYLVFP